jgi:Carbohydrate family 9 binding domain-like
VLPRLECKRRKSGGVTVDAAEWDGMPPVFLRETVAGGSPLQATWMKILWDDHALHVLFQADDTNTWATYTEHDAPLYEEEVVEVFLDPVGDLESYFEIEVNPLNAVCDLVLRRARSGWRKDFGWHCEGLKTVVKKSDAAWTVEMVIPFASLGTAAQPEAGKTWRANFYRIDRPENSPWELSAWSPTGQPLFHVQEKFGFLEFAD